MNKLCVIPFSGFYESWHDDAIDSDFNMSLSDDSGALYDDLHNRAWDDIEWGAVHQAYAREFCEHWAHLAGLKGVKFETLDSPREYNFTTDRIFANIPLRELWRMRRKTPADILASVAADIFTSQSGFYSFYSPDVSEWGPLTKWDHNQCFALIKAFCKHGDVSEHDIIEDISCNGCISNCIDKGAGKKANRCFTVAYLRRDRMISARDAK